MSSAAPKVRSTVFHDQSGRELLVVWQQKRHNTAKQTDHNLHGNRGEAIELIARKIFPLKFDGPVKSKTNLTI